MSNNEQYQSLSTRAILVTLNISAWSGHKRDRNITQDLCREKHAKNNSIRANKSLVGDEIRDVRSSQRSLRDYFHEHTLCWNGEGTRILKADTFREFRQNISTYLNSFQEEVNKFIENYPEVIENARLRLGDAWREEDFPTTEQIRNSFSASLSYAPLPSSSSTDFRISISDDEAEIIRENIERQTMRSLKAAHSEILNRLREPLVRYAQKLSLYRVTENGTENIFRDSLVENVRSIVDLAPHLDLTNDPAISRLCEMIRNDITGTDASSLRLDQNLRDHSVERAQKIVEEIDSLGF